MITLSWVRKVGHPAADTHQGPPGELQSWQLDLELCPLAQGLPKSAQCSPGVLLKCTGVPWA